MLKLVLPLNVNMVLSLYFQPKSEKHSYLYNIPKTRKTKQKNQIDEKNVIRNGLMMTKSDDNRNYRVS